MARGTIAIAKTDITKLTADAIVNAANGELREGSGVCGAIFAAAGREEMTKACAEYDGCLTGYAVITPGFALKAKYVIHAVGPIYPGPGGELAAGALYSCYKESLDLARKHECYSIGFPLISTGIYGYPKEEAWPIAIDACKDWLNENASYPMEIVFAVLDDETKEMGEEVLYDSKAPDNRAFIS